MKLEYRSVPTNRRLDEYISIFFSIGLFFSYILTLDTRLGSSKSAVHRASNV